MAEPPQLGELVAVTTTDSEPWLVVTQVEADTIEGVLLADCADETLRRLAATVDDGERRRELARRCDGPSCPRSRCRRRAIVTSRQWSVVAGSRSRRGSADAGHVVAPVGPGRSTEPPRPR